MHKFPGIKVKNNPSNNLSKDVCDALETINSKPSGTHLLRSIASLANEEKFVLIKNARLAEDIACVPQLTAKDLEKLINKFGLDFTQKEYDDMRIKQSSSSTPFKRRGCSATIRWNKELSQPLLDPEGGPIPGTCPEYAYITLAHELVHAKHQLAGTCKYSGDLNPSEKSATTRSGKEELRAIGLGKYAYSGEPSENTIRQEHGLPKRLKYTLSGGW